MFSLPRPSLPPCSVFVLTPLTDLRSMRTFPSPRKLCTLSVQVQRFAVEYSIRVLVV